MSLIFEIVVAVSSATEHQQKCYILKYKSQIFSLILFTTIIEYRTYAFISFSTCPFYRFILQLLSWVSIIFRLFSRIFSLLCTIKMCDTLNSYPGNHHVYVVRTEKYQNNHLLQPMVTTRLLRQQILWYTIVPSVCPA